jgi:hypothetical protein
VIGEDKVKPTIVVTQPNDITCLATSASLNATGSTPATGVTIQWTALDGGVVTSPNSLMASTTAGGSYEILIQNNVNGCESRDTVMVTANNQAPTISITTPSAFSCTGLPVSIDAGPSGPVNSFSSITWTSISGGGSVTPASGSLSVLANGAGDYALTLVSAANGCSATDTVTVAAATDTPVADAGQNQDLDCGDVAQLGGPNTTTGPTFSTQWTVIEGAALTGSTSAPTTTTEGQGIYQLIVTNTANGCRDTATVEINYTTPGDANAGQDASLCEDGTTLSGNLPAGTTGQWTSLSGAVVTAPDQATSDVTGLQEGDNIFVWTLSAPGCPSYDADSVVVMTESSPVANNDLVEIPANSRDASLNLAANDIVGPDFTLTLISEM